MNIRHKTEGGHRYGRSRRKGALAALLLAAALIASAARAAQSNKLTVGVTDSGFSPSEATADPGLVHLTLENRGGAERVKLQFARQGGAAISELEVGGHGDSLATELEVEAGGVYTLTEEEHGWVFRLTVSGTAPSPPAQAPPEGK
jgi:ABC-type amino acid transport substrate-binding protein